MQRRTLLKLGVASAAVLAVAGAGVALLGPGVAGGRLTDAGRRVFHGVARAVLDGALPADDAARERALSELLARIDDTVAVFPDAVRSDLSRLLGLLDSSAGRWGLAGLRQPWTEASVADLQAALQHMRLSSLSLRQQAYHALRDLAAAAFYADDAQWPALGYPGPRTV